MKIIIILIMLILQVYSQLNLNTEFEQDSDIQGALIGICRRLPRECPIVLIHDEQMPILSVSHIFIKRMESHERMFVILNLSVDQLYDFDLIYGSNSTEPGDIIHAALVDLYRKGKCYVFIVWVKDPRILYPDTNIHHHPGWRSSDHIILVVHHITKRYRSMTNLKIWNNIPNVIGLKRNKPELEGVVVNIFTVFPYFKNGRRKSQELDLWLVKEKLFLKDNYLFPEKFHNMHNASLSLGVLWKEPFFIWGNKIDPWLDGLDWRLFSLCRDRLNFTLRIVNIPQTGRRIEGDRWTGILGTLADGKITVGVGGISVTAERRQHFDFCRTYYTDSYNFIAPLNSNVSSALNTFLRPLSNEVWICTFVTILIGIITLKIVAFLEKFLMKNELDSHFNSLTNNCGFVITILFQKPYRHLPRTFAIKSVHFGMIIMTFLLGMAFSSCLIAVLLDFKPKPIADTVADILKTRLPISIKNYDGFLNEYMNASENPDIKEIFRQGKLVDYYQTYDTMNQVVKGEMIYIDSKAKITFSGKYRYSAGPVGLKFHISSESILKFDNLGWPVNKNWPFMKKVDDIISRAVESGLVGHWMTQFQRGHFGGSSEAWKIPQSAFNLSEKIDPIPEVVVISSNNAAKFVKLTMEHVLGVYTMYTVGAVLSIILFIIECLIGVLTAISAYTKNALKKYRKPLLLTSENHIDVEKSIIISKPKITDKPIKQKAKLPAKTRNWKKKKQTHPQFPDLVWDDFKQAEKFHNKLE